MCEPDCRVLSKHCLKYYPPDSDEPRELCRHLLHDSLPLAAGCRQDSLMKSARLERASGALRAPPNAHFCLAPQSQYFTLADVFKVNLHIEFFLCMAFCSRVFLHQQRSNLATCMRELLTKKADNNVECVARALSCTLSHTTTT